MQAAVKDIVEKSLEKAREHDKRGNIGLAYAYYTVVIELCPAKRAKVEKIFTDVLCEWGMHLALNDRIHDVINCYEHSLDIYPNNCRMLNNFAAHLLRNDTPVKAIEYLKQALIVDPDFLPAERNLQNAYSMAVDRWHFPMLNDKYRNNAFREAIRKRIVQGYDTVLDIGTGTGLLSLYARDSGARKVYACECSSVMVSIAKKVFKRNDAEKIELIPEFSYNLSIPKDIPERVKLIVTETFDAGLFGELVVPSMIDAHANLLVKNGLGMVIPQCATLFIAAAESEHIRFKSTIVFKKDAWPDLLNFDNMYILPDDEYYDTENLENIKINYVTEPKEILRVNFNDLSELRDFSRDGIKGVARAKCRYDGIIDGLVAWFQLYLDEEIAIDSSQGKSCWQFAVFPAIPATYRQGDNLSITTEMSNGKLKCSYVPDQASNIDSKVIYRLPTEVIMFLNDFEYVKLLTRLSKCHKERCVKHILDTSPFPVYGLMMLKENENCEVLYFQTDNPVISLVIRQVAIDSGIQGRVCIVSDYSEIQCLLDVILIHNFDVKGELKDWGQQNSHELFSHLLDRSALLLPQRIFLMGQLIFSADLPKMTRVKDANVQKTSLLVSSSSSSEKNSDEESEINFEDTADFNTSNYVISEYINEYKINQVFDLNSSLYQYTPLSDVQTLIQIDETRITESVVNFGKIEVTNSKFLPNALVCWYRINVTPDYALDTKRSNSFMNHTAVVLEDELRHLVLQEKEIKIKVLQMNGLVKVSTLLA